MRVLLRGGADLSGFDKHRLQDAIVRAPYPQYAKVTDVQDKLSRQKRGLDYICEIEA